MAHRGHWREATVISCGAAIAVLAVVLLSARASQRVNLVPMEASARPVSVVAAAKATYRDSRTYVGSVEPWVEADVGPQYVAAYVLTVLVRPGAVVKRGDVLATLDCSTPSAASRAVEMRARGLEARASASEHEAARLTTLLDGGFIAPNEVELRSAASLDEQARLLEAEANLVKSSLDVRDCVLRAPFDGEVGTRTCDPGAFVRPGASIVSVVNRDVVRVSVDAPEKDFDAIAPFTVVNIDVTAVGVSLSAPIARRAPRADPSTRTIHFEMDVPDLARRYPVGTTAIVRVDVGDPVAATTIPLYAATESAREARFFEVSHEMARARTAPVLGEIGGALFFKASTLLPGTLVVTEGRALLSDGDKVQLREEDTAPQEDGDAGPVTRGGGFGRSL